MEDEKNNLIESIDNLLVKESTIISEGDLYLLFLPEFRALSKQLTRFKHLIGE